MDFVEGVVSEGDAFVQIGLDVGSVAREEVEGSQIVPLGLTEGFTATRATSDEELACH